jgi:hypothetical protein
VSTTVPTLNQLFPLLLCSNQQTPYKEGQMENYKYLSPHQIATSEEYPFTIGQVRHLLLMRHKNGLEKAIRKIGKRLYVKRDLFESWIESQREGTNV